MFERWLLTHKDTLVYVDIGYLSHAVAISLLCYPLLPTSSCCNCSVGSLERICPIDPDGIHVSDVSFRKASSLDRRVEQLMSCLYWPSHMTILIFCYECNPFLDQARYFEVVAVKKGTVRALNHSHCSIGAVLSVLNWARLTNS